MASRFFLLLVLLVLLAQSVLCASFDHGRTISYQVHSANDLREWPQWILKGARSFKIDPYYTKDESVCDSGPCFVFTHDKPEKTIRYNTTDQLLSGLESNWLDLHLFQSSSGFDIRIALCFKNEPNVCDDSQDTKIWLAMVDEFVERANKVSAVYASRLNGTLEFILDGGAKPLNCLSQRWRPWKSVWIDNPPDALWSDDESKGYDRFQILNDPEVESSWKILASVGFGKFRNSSYPLQLWEPDEQEKIHKFQDIYLNSGIVHKPGFHFSINVDYSMFEVYSASRTKRSWNHNYFENPEAQNTKILLRPRIAGFNYSNKTIVVSCAWHQHQQGTWNIVCGIHQINPVGQKPSIIKDPTTISFENGDSVFSTDDPENAQLSLSLCRVNGFGKEEIVVLLSNATGFYSLLSLNTERSWEFKAIASGSFKDLIPELSQTEGIKETFTSTIISTPDHQGLQFLVVRSNPCGITVFKLELKDLIDSISLPNTMSMLSCFPSSVIPVTLSIASWYDRSLEAVEYFLVISDGKEMEALFSTPKMEPKWILFHAGSEPHASVGFIDETPVLLVVNGDGYCFNSHQRNTQAFPMVCDAHPSSSQWVLDYTIGKTDAFKQHWINSPSVSFITPCHTSIQSGTYDLGTNPSALLLPAQYDDKQAHPSSVLLIEMHEGFPNGAQDQTHCGPAKFRDGIVIDGWPIKIPQN